MLPRIERLFQPFEAAPRHDRYGAQRSDEHAGKSRPQPAGRSGRRTSVSQGRPGPGRDRCRGGGTLHDVYVPRSYIYVCLCMDVCVCMHKCVCVCVRAFVCVCRRRCSRVCISMYLRVCKHVCRKVSDKHLSCAPRDSNGLCLYPMEDSSHQNFQGSGVWRLPHLCSKAFTLFFLFAM